VAGSVAAEPRVMRSRADACPGALDLHPAADGLLARIRVPGGLLDAAALRALADLAQTCGDGALEVTSRANLQLRGVRDASGLARGLAGAGLLPSAAHDRARNLATSPLTGLGLPAAAGGGTRDARPLLAALDAALLSDPGLAELSGRFTLAVDDGSGLAPAADVGLRPSADGPGLELLLDGRPAGVGSVEAALAAARGFLRLRAGQPGIWRVRDLPGGADGLAAALGRQLGAPASPLPARLPLGPRRGGTVPVLVAAAWLQRLSAPQVRAVAGAVAPGGQARLAPAGRVVVPLAAPAAAARLRTAGLLVDPGDPRGQITACTGVGGCARAAVDVRALAAAAAVPGAPPQHLVACPRRCGLPADAAPLVLSGA